MTNLKLYCFWMNSPITWMRKKGLQRPNCSPALGYNLHFVPSTESGRTYISKGLLKKARKIANLNIRNFSTDTERKEIACGNRTLSLAYLPG